MAPAEVGGTSRDSPSRMRSRHALKKGPWTAAEDQLLQDYVKKHGEGNWNAVQRHSGLMRCGKSCRLRWANHLRPDLKKGAFSPEEEQLIVELHAKLGNKWARMAAQIPGRTDNEIKNYWNTRVKRRLRDGLPIYPQELVDQELRHPPPPPPQPQTQPQTPPPPPQQKHHHQGSSSQTHSLSSLLALPANPLTFNRPVIRRSDDHRQSQRQTHHAPYASSQLKLYRDDNGGLALSLDASSSTFSSSSFFDHGVADQLPISHLVQHNFFDYGAPKSFGKEPSELPSIQAPPGTAAVGAPAAAFHEYVVEDVEVGGRNHSSLFADLFGESGDEQFVAEGGHFHGASSSHEGVEAKASNESMAAIDDELMNLLDNFPLSVPIPEWNGGDGRESPILNNGTNGAMHGQPEPPEYNPVAATSEAANQDPNFGSSLWNNMPTIH